MFRGVIGQLAMWAAPKISPGVLIFAWRKKGSEDLVGEAIGQGIFGRPKAERGTAVPMLLRKVD